MTKEELKAFHLEVIRAATPGRLGISQGDAFEWLLRFAQADLKNLSEGDWRNLAYEIACFIEYKYGDALNETGFPEEAWCRKNWEGKPYCSKDPFKESLSTAGIQHAIEVYRDAFRLQPSLPNIDEICLLQSQARDAFNGIVEKNSLALRCPSPDLFFLRFPKSNISQLVTLADSPFDLFTNHLIEYLKQFHKGLARCPECRLIFWGRSNRTFCSQKCQNRVAVRRFRGIPAERKGKVGRPPMATSIKKDTSRVKSNRKKSQPTKSRRAK